MKENPNITFNKDGTVDIREPYIEKKKKEEKEMEDRYVKQSRLMDQYHEEAIKNGILPSTDVYTEENNNNGNNSNDDDELMRKLNELVRQEEEIEKQKEEEKRKRNESNNNNNRRCNFCNMPDPQFKCVKCKTTFYCSKECQKADWKKHKKVCKSIESSKELSLPPPPSIPPSSSPHLIDDSDSAFNGRVIEHSIYNNNNIKNDKVVKNNDEEEQQPKKISKFKQRRMNKE